MLAEDHPDQLASQHVLVIAYQADWQVKEAVALLEHVAAIREHPSRPASQYELAIAYRANEQVKEAVTLLEHMVTIERTHPSRIVSEDALITLHLESLA